MSRRFLFFRRLPSVVLAALLLLPMVAGAADIFEPWDRGFSDAEIFAGVAEGGTAAAQALAGFGLGRRVSLGLSMSTDEGESSRFGVFLGVTRDVGRNTDLSFWLQSALGVGTLDVELIHADWTAGCQLVHWREGMVPYGVLSVAGEEGENLRLHPLVGVMFPTGRLEIHLELSSDQPQCGAWPVHLAIGPNVHVKPWLEVLPEISFVRESGGEIHWVATVGVIVDPRHWCTGHPS